MRDCQSNFTISNQQGNTNFWIVTQDKQDYFFNLTGAR